MKKLIKLTIIFFGFILITNQTVLSCTVFHASNDQYAFGGNNEDYNDPDTYIYFIPGNDHEYGKVIVGYTGNYWIQGGMNEKGLFWDGLATAYLEVLNSADKPYFNGHLVDYILGVCETCDEALEIYDMYNLKIFEYAQILMGDQYGDSFIIEGDVVHRKSDYFQLCTNYYLSQYPNPPYPCWRYRTALEMFQNNPIEDLSQEFCAQVLDSVHQEGSYPTQYSTVYDLKNKLIYIYHNHNYNKVKIFNLTEELKLGYHEYSIPALFEDNSPPNSPSKPNGPINGKINIPYSFTTSALDPDGDEIYYMFDWGNGEFSPWLGPYDSEETCRTSYTWVDEETYEIRVKAKDSNNEESEWSESLSVTMPKTKTILNQLAHRLINSYPLIYKIFQKINNINF